MIDRLLGDLPAEDWRLYWPVLRAKASEWRALEALNPGVRGRIAPIIEFIPEWKGPGSTTSIRKRRPQTPAEYVDRMLVASATATPSGSRTFVDFSRAGPTGTWEGVDLWSAFDKAVPVGIRVIPLASLSSVARTSSLVRAAQARGEVGIRLEVADIGPGLGARLTSALQGLRIPEASVHVVVDLGNAPTAVSHAAVRAALVRPGAFSSVAVLGGVFPLNLTAYQQGVTAEARTEWQTWWRERVATPGADRILAFGDYTTQCADYQPAPEVPGSVSLRYTIDDAVLVFRGRQSNSNSGLGHEQMHGHCRLLVARSDYDGASFSWGDHRINCWTNPANGPGNAMQWRTASVAHHITHVVVQLQDPVGSSATARAWARGQTAAACR